MNRTIIKNAKARAQSLGMILHYMGSTVGWILDDTKISRGVVIGRTFKDIDYAVEELMVNRKLRGVTA